jgi:hypothetical protein
MSRAKHADFFGARDFTQFTAIAFCPRIEVSIARESGAIPDLRRSAEVFGSEALNGRRRGPADSRI